MPICMFAVAIVVVIEVGICIGMGGISELVWADAGKDRATAIMSSHKKRIWDFRLSKIFPDEFLSEPETSAIFAKPLAHFAT